MAQCFRTSVTDFEERVAYVGVVAAVCGNLIIASAMNILKHSYVVSKPSRINPTQLLLLPDRKSSRWWVGVCLRSAGETTMLLSNGFAASSVIAVTNTVSAIFHALYAVIFFGEKPRRSDVVGMFLIVSGCLLAILFGPGRGSDMGAHELLSEVIPRPQAWIFLLASFFCLLGALAFANKYGEEQMLGYVLVWAILRMVAVMGSKAYASSIKLAYFNGQWLEQFSTPVPWGSLCVVSVTSGVAALYLNKAVSTYGNREVIPVSQSLALVLCVVGAATMYKEFDCSDAAELFLYGLGVILAIVGLFLVDVARSDKSLYIISSVYLLEEQVRARLAARGIFTYSERARSFSRQVVFHSRLVGCYSTAAVLQALSLVYTTVCNCPPDRPHSVWLLVVEIVLSLLLSLELLLRAAGTGRVRFWSSLWNRYDVVVALSTIPCLFFFFALPFLSTRVGSTSLSVFLAIRDILRLSRLVCFIQNAVRLYRRSPTDIQLADTGYDDPPGDVAHRAGGASEWAGYMEGVEQTETTKPTDNDDVESPGGLGGWLHSAAQHLRQQSGTQESPRAILKFRFV